MDGLVNSFETDFCVAVIPVQLALLYFYIAGKPLPLREVRSFLVLMAVNLISMVASLFYADMGTRVGAYPVWLMYLVSMLYGIATCNRPFWLFYYMADATGLSGKRGTCIRRIVVLPLLAIAVLAVTTPWTGLILYASPLEGYVAGPLYRWIPVYYGFYVIMSAALILASWGRRSLGKNLSFLSAVLLMNFGIYWKYIIGGGHVLVMGYFTTLAVFILFLTRRNPDLYRDGDTGLFNKAAFMLVMRERMAAGPVRGVAFAVRDFERLRLIYGADFISLFLKQVKAASVHGFQNAYDFYFNGGRFFLLANDEVDVRQWMGTIHRWFSGQWDAGSRRISIAVDTLGLDGSVRLDSPEELVSIMHMAIRRKGAGKPQDMMLNDDVMYDMKEELRVRRLISRAVDGKGLEMFLQPVMNAKTGRLEGAEALARLRAEDGTIVPPDRFIPLSESTGAIHALGLQMIEKVCAFAVSEDFARCGMKWINVNVSPVQCLDRQLADKIETVRATYHVPKSCIRLEITEQSILSDRGMEQVQKFHTMGYELALDDFGSGYSNSSRLRQLPFTEIKLDMGIVRAHFARPDDYLPRVVHGMHGLSMAVVAEGVEYKDWADALAAMGVDYLQGYYFSRPIPVGEFVEKYGKAGTRTGQN